MTPNTIFECVKNYFLLSNPKLVFFTEFNLRILKKNIIGDDMIYNNNKNIFTKITNLLELKYEEIQRLLLPDQVKKRGNLKNFTEKGKHI